MSTIYGEGFVADRVPACQHCADTGDVHDLSGEWRGYCACPAGIELRGIDAEHDPHRVPVRLVESAPREIGQGLDRYGEWKDKP